MPCYHPLKAWRTKEVNPETGKTQITFSRGKAAFVDLPFELPCGQCIGCRLEKSRQWAMRCLHEAQMHERNCFVTLTYDEEHIPNDWSLRVEDWQKFMKRLRKRYGEGIRFYHCGEYGDENGRPHYHGLIFNHDFVDRRPWKKGPRHAIDISGELQELWTDGFSTVGNVSFESAAYVARYQLKKITGEKADEHYEFMVPDTGEIVHRKPEYATMSRRPGIGDPWFEKFAADAYPSDYIIMRGRKMRPPKYYESKVEELLLRHLRVGRARMGRKLSVDNTVDRRRVREKVKIAQIKQLKRNLK